MAITAREPAEPGAMVPVPYRVNRARRETHDTVTLDLEPLDGDRPGFRPGQFNMLYAFGKGEVPISISGDPTRPGPLVHTVRAVGHATRTICAARKGEVLGVRGPFGSAWPIERATGRDLVIVAGGIGLAPLRPALYEVLSRRGTYHRVSLFYGTRSPADILFRRELQAWRGRFDLDVEVTVDHAAGEAFENVGVVTRVLRRAAFEPGETTALVCGPEVMMRFAVSDLLERGVAEQDVWVSMERNMQCAIGLCGHCQFGPEFVCKDGPVFRYADVERLFRVREV
jgi:NAD(P)H-flavin reductase